MPKNDLENELAKTRKELSRAMNLLEKCGSFLRMIPKNDFQELGGKALMIAGTYIAEIEIETEADE